AGVRWSAFWTLWASGGCCVAAICRGSSTRTGDGLADGGAPGPVPLRARLGRHRAGRPSDVHAALHRPVDRLRASAAIRDTAVVLVVLGRRRGDPAGLCHSPAGPRLHPGPT